MAENERNIPSEQELRKWLDLTSQGDQESFALLMRTYVSKVYSQAITYLKSTELAQEVTQDVFIKLWGIREKLAEVNDFSSYLFILSRNEIISSLRKKQWMHSTPSEELEALILPPDHQLEYKEAYQNFLRLIEQLPPIRRKVFTLSRLEGKSYEEIGEALGISRNGVKDHIVKALNFLRTNFRSELLFVLIWFVEWKSDNFF